MFELGLEIVNKDYIKIRNFPVRQFQHDVTRKWGTSKIFNLYASAYNFFSRNYGSLLFHQFFLVEFDYILSALPHRQAYIQARQLVKDKTWIGNVDKEMPHMLDFNMLNKLKRKLMPHQLKFLEVYDQKKQQYNLKGYLNAFEQGLGKSTIALALMECLHKDKVFIVAPNNTVYTSWIDEIHASFGLEDNPDNPYKIWTLKTPVNPKEAKYFIINYESMDKMLGLIGSNNLATYNTGLVIDEIHHFRNLKTDRSQNAIAISDLLGTKDTLCMSGTPIKALGAEAIPLLMLIDPLFKDPAIIELFKKAFGVASAACTDIVANRLGTVMYRVEKKDVLKLPEKEEITLQVKLPNGKDYTLKNMALIIKDFVYERSEYYKENYDTYEQQYLEILEWFEYNCKYDPNEYRDYWNKVQRIRGEGNGYSSPIERSKDIEWCNEYERRVIIPQLSDYMKKEFKKAKSVYKYVDLVIMGEVIGGLLPKYRAQLYMDIMEKGPVIDLVRSAFKKTLIFTTFGSVVEKAVEVLQKNKYNPVAVYQKTANDRVKYIEMFKTDPKINPMVTTTQMMSTGVTLNEANVVIFAPQPFRYVDYEQAYSRCWRIGQTDPVYVYTLVLDTGNEPNLSTRIEDISNWSKDLFEKIVKKKIDTTGMQETVETLISLNGLESFVSNDLDLYLSAY